MVEKELSYIISRMLEERDKRKMKKNQIIIFIVEFIAMAIEICMSYILSPYFGNSNIVWTGVVSVILLSNSIGNWIGGVFKKNRAGQMLLLSTLFLSISLCVAPLLSYWMCRLPIDNTISAILTTVILLLPCEICIGTIPSQIMRNETSKSPEGKRIGIIYALSTVGGVVGSILSGFILIPKLGADITLSLCIGLLLLTGLIVRIINTSERLNPYHFFAPFIQAVITIGMVILYFYGNLNAITSIGIRDNASFYVSADSEYSRIEAYDGYYKGDPVRIMKIGTGLESASYRTEDKKFDMVFDYCKAGAAITQQLGKVDADMLIIGGGAYQIPKYYLAHTDYNIDVIEIDDKITEIASKYFYLDECIERYDREQTRFVNINMDAKVFLNNNKTIYDYILNDAFSGIDPVRTLTTVETVRQIKAALSDKGVYMTNLIASKNGPRSKFLQAEANTIAQVFKHVYVIHVDPDNTAGEDTVINSWIIASDHTLPLMNEYDYTDGLVITDNYCPIELLLR